MTVDFVTRIAADCSTDGRVFHRCGKPATTLRRPADAAGTTREDTRCDRCDLLARVGLAPRERVLLADEPTGNLDSEGDRNVLALLSRIRDERGTTLVLLTPRPLDRGAEATGWVWLLAGRIDEARTRAPSDAALAASATG